MEQLNLWTLHKLEISSCCITLVHICFWNTMTCEILCFRCINKLQFSNFNLYQWPWPLTLWNIRIYHPSIKNAKYYRVTIEPNIMHQIASCLESLSCSLHETICSILKIDFQLCFHWRPQYVVSLNGPTGLIPFWVLTVYIYVIIQFGLNMGLAPVQWTDVECFSYVNWQVLLQIIANALRLNGKLIALSICLLGYKIHEHRYTCIISKQI